MELLQFEGNKINAQNAHRVFETLFKMCLPDFLDALSKTNYVSTEILT